MGSWTEIFVYVVITALIMWRTDVVYRANKKAIMAISKLNVQRIDVGDYSSSDDLWEIYEGKGWGLMIVDMRKWSFEQFYPELAK